jgi:23S rRNA (adenine1618-N6)-methyltransferase
MHENNPFFKDYDFKKLVKCHPDLKDYLFTNVYKKVTVKFSDPKAVKALNTALLKSQYGIDWDIPDKNLCPPIPGRLDYLIHVSELIQKDEVHMLDIGTGASLIYPILATCHFNWKCTASETIKQSLNNAQKLIQKNPALRGITLLLQDNKNEILENIIHEKDYFDVLVCNPPFFKNEKEATKQNERKARNLKLGKTSKNFSGISHELWFPGGEKKFIQILIRESVKFKNHVQWFTTLVSSHTNLGAICNEIKKTKPTGFEVVSMNQGNKKSHFVAWSYL